jgi:hypothetical protein
VAIPQDRGLPSGRRPQRGVGAIEMLSQASALVLVEAARETAGPCKEAVGERGSPLTGLPALVKRRREHRVTGGQSRTESRALETMNPNATGSRQTNRSHVP